jgi:NADP-dependent 3-hydroxy acid dehydrogenase YdfG
MFARRPKEATMMLENKTAAIYGGGGAIGGAVAHAFAAAGARVYLAGRSMPRLEKVANDIGDAAGVAEVDALDERAVADHADAVAADAGGIDTALNAVSFPFVHDTPLAELTVDDVMHPIDAYLRTNLITAMAVARHMTAPRSGTILTLSAGAARVLSPGESRLRHRVRGDRDDDPAPRGRARTERRPCQLSASSPDRRRTLQRLLHR